MTPVRIGVLGLGTVGGGTVNVLRRNGEEIARRAGRGIVVARAAVRSPHKERICATGGIALTTDPGEIVRDPHVEVVVELIGGTDPARQLVLEAIERGKHVVTANKALIAMHGNAIFEAAQRKRGDGGVRSRGGRRDPDHQGVARRAGREPDRVARRDHQRHEQLHPDRDARPRRRVLRSPRRGATARLRRGGSHVRRRGSGCRAQARHPRRHRVRHAARLRAGAYGGHHPGDAGRRRLRRAARLPHQASRDREAHPGPGWRCGCIRRWSRNASSSRTSTGS